MLTAEQNYRLLQEIEANRRFLLMAYQQNPKLLESAEMRIKQLFEMPARGVDNSLSSVLSPQSSERGISLIELIMFIVIVSVALAGILLVMNVTTRGSADPLILKQSLAIAESLLEEVQLMPFTFCDPDDANAANAASAVAAECPAAGGVGGLEGLGAETDANGTETRYSATIPFDNVNDYDGCQMNTGTINGCDTTGTNGIRDINNNPIGPASGYTASIVILPTGLTLVPALPADGDALRITVTVTGPGGASVTVDGIRTRYSPRGVP